MFDHIRLHAFHSPKYWHFFFFFETKACRAQLRRKNNKMYEKVSQPSCQNDTSGANHPTMWLSTNTTHYHGSSLLSMEVKLPAGPTFHGRPPTSHPPTSLKVTAATGHHCQAQTPKSSSHFQSQTHGSHRSRGDNPDVTPSGRERRRWRHRRTSKVDRVFTLG